MVVNLLFVLTIAAGILGLVDGVARLRGRRGGGAVIAVAEIVFAVLMLLSLFVAFPVPFGFLTWCILLEVALVLALILSGGVRRGTWVITILALLLNTIVLLRTLGWLTIPGVL